MKEFKLSIIGFGTVGRSLGKLIINKRSFIEEKLGLKFKINAIFEYNGAFINENEGLNLKKLVKLPPDKYPEHEDWKPNYLAVDHLDSINSDIVIEMTKTNIKDAEPAFTHIMTALNNNMDVVTSNKGPLALYYPELMRVVKKNELLLRFEASVGGVIPILGTYKNLLLANKVNAILGILNGTTNYILTKMTLEKIPFDIALQEAQENGYAEADPTLDIEGVDAACKLVILANTILNYESKLDDVERQGIDKITLEAIDLARDEGYAIKHVALARNGKLEVAPKLIPDDHTLDIEGTKNIIILETEEAGEIVISGRGAGGVEAASAILSDLLYVCNTRKKEII
ncbi:MAG: homoserine dehydrogenase [Candidatus Lokiarchaeota archaeon]|nr:homoserine dehydrogenase [Candidatus Lokiarchaeota archaeon]